MVDVVAVIVIGIAGKEAHTIFGTSWFHRIIWQDVSPDTVDDALLMLFRSKI
jgi:hypothetical protein